MLLVPAVTRDLVISSFFLGSQLFEVMLLVPAVTRELVISSFFLGSRKLLGCLSKPSLAVLVVKHGTEEVILPKIGPEGFCEIEFGIGNLPQKKITYPVLPAGANKEIGIGNAA